MLESLMLQNIVFTETWNEPCAAGLTIGLYSDLELVLLVGDLDPQQHRGVIRLYGVERKGDVVGALGADQEYEERCVLGRRGRRSRRGSRWGLRVGLGLGRCSRTPSVTRERVVLRQDGPKA